VTEIAIFLVVVVIVVVMAIEVAVEDEVVAVEVVVEVEIVERLLASVRQYFFLLRKRGPKLWVPMIEIAIWCSHRHPVCPYR